MSRSHVTSRIHEILGYYPGGYHYSQDFHRKKAETIVTIQDCNMGGSYFRNYYILNEEELCCFKSNTDFFENKNYTEEKLEKFMWKRELKSE